MVVEGKEEVLEQCEEVPPRAEDPGRTGAQASEEARAVGGLEA